MFRTREKRRLLQWFFLSSLLPFAIELLLVMPLVLGFDAPAMGPFYIFIAPWLLALIVLLNLPFASAVFRAFRMTLATRRNHALEHATIYYLRRGDTRRTKRRRVAGEASEKGFRVSGDFAPGEIRRAFQAVSQRVLDGQPIPHISRHCGSNRVTAMGVALLFLFAITVVILLVRPPMAVRVAGLAIGVLVFFGLRHRLGDWMQGRFFMATDFTRVSIRDIRRVKADADEHGPVHFVETIVQVEAPSA